MSHDGSRSRGESHLAWPLFIEVVSFILGSSCLWAMSPCSLARLCWEELVRAPLPRSPGCSAGFGDVPGRWASGPCPRRAPPSVAGRCGGWSSSGQAHGAESHEDAAWGGCSCARLGYPANAAGPVLRNVPMGSAILTRCPLGAATAHDVEWVQQPWSLWGSGHAVQLPSAPFLLFEGCAWGGCSLQASGFGAVPSNVSAVPLHPLANLGRCSHSPAHPGDADGCRMCWVLWGGWGSLCSPEPLGAVHREGSVLSCLSPPPRYRSRCSHSSSSRSSCGSYGRSRDRSSSSSSSSSYSSRSPSRRQSRSRSPSPRRRSNRRRR